jgi:hypothetical protein
MFLPFFPCFKGLLWQKSAVFMIFRNFEKSRNILGHLLDREPYDVRVRSEKHNAPDERVHPRGWNEGGK